MRSIRRGMRRRSSCSSGLAYDERAAREAALLAAESRALLRAAGEHGLDDASIARTARDLFQLALDGARRLGPAYVDPRSRDAQHSTRLHGRSRSPGTIDALRTRRGDRSALVRRGSARPTRTSRGCGPCARDRRASEESSAADRAGASGRRARNVSMSSSASGDRCPPMKPPSHEPRKKMRRFF